MLLFILSVKAQFVLEKNSLILFTNYSKIITLNLSWILKYFKVFLLFIIFAEEIINCKLTKKFIFER